MGESGPRHGGDEAGGSTMSRRRMRRRRRGRAGARRPAILLSLLIAILALVFGVLQLGDEDSRGPTPSAVAPVALQLDAAQRIDLAAVATEPARVERIIDGDTLIVRLGATGGRDGGRETIRLFGLQAPERGRACADAATARLSTLAPPGTTVLLHPGPRNDDGERLLRYVFSPRGRSLDAMLVAEGLAQAWQRDGQLREAIIALEGAAREAERGCLWQ